MLVVLKNKSRYEDSAVLPIFLALKRLDVQRPELMHALWRNCQGMKISTVDADALKERHLLQADGQPSQTVQDLVLSGVSGEGIGASFGSPFA